MEWVNGQLVDKRNDGPTRTTGDATGGCMDATKRLPKLTADGANIISGEHVDRVMIAACLTPDQAEKIVRAVNRDAVFDQARAALEELLGDLDDGIHDGLGTGGVSSATLIRARQVLVKMKG